tara:strand:- start:208 stop:765 length:558 start_codon:yes stop_codon:yes gene_type:complete
MKVVRGLLFLTVIYTFGCGAGENRTNVELIQDMMDQISVKAQDWNPNVDPDFQAMRVPPENTVPRGFKPYPYTLGEVEKASRELRNPLSGQFGAEVLARGKKHFEINCAVCHGADGAGKGPVASKMAVPPPSLIEGKVLGYTEGRIFHAITLGWGVMGSYSRQIRKEEDRWAVINYIKNLQKKAN